MRSHICGIRPFLNLHLCGKYAHFIRISEQVFLSKRTYATDIVETHVMSCHSIRCKLCNRSFLFCPKVLTRHLRDKHKDSLTPTWPKYSNKYLFESTDDKAVDDAEDDKETPTIIEVVTSANSGIQSNVSCEPETPLKILESVDIPSEQVKCKEDTADQRFSDDLADFSKVNCDLCNNVMLHSEIKLHTKEFHPGKKPSFNITDKVFHR